jgi:hypothetical protein
MSTPIYEPVVPNNYKAFHFKIREPVLPNEELRGWTERIMRESYEYQNCPLSVQSRRRQRDGETVEVLFVRSLILKLRLITALALFVPNGSFSLD